MQEIWHNFIMSKQPTNLSCLSNIEIQYDFFYNLIFDMYILFTSNLF